MRLTGIEPACLSAQEPNGSVTLMQVIVKNKSTFFALSGLKFNKADYKGPTFFLFSFTNIGGHISNTF